MGQIRFENGHRYSHKKRLNDIDRIPSLCEQVTGRKAKKRAGTYRTDNGAELADEYIYVPFSKLLERPLMDVDALVDDWVNDRLNIIYSID